MTKISALLHAVGFATVFAWGAILETRIVEDDSDSVRIGVCDIGANRLVIEKEIVMEKQIDS